MGKQSKLTDSQKVELVLTLLRGEESAAKLARRFGVSEQTVYRYRDAFLEGGRAGLASKDTDAKKRIKQLEKEIEQREQVIGEITIANRILPISRRAYPPSSAPRMT